MSVTVCCCRGHVGSRTNGACSRCAHCTPRGVKASCSTTCCWFTNLTRGRPHRYHVHARIDGSSGMAKGRFRAVGKTSQSRVLHLSSCSEKCGRGCAARTHPTSDRCTWGHDTVEVANANKLDIARCLASIVRVRNYRLWRARRV